MKNIMKKKYEKPQLEVVRIDNEVALVMGSTAPSPGDAPDPGAGDSPWS